LAASLAFGAVGCHKRAKRQAAPLAQLQAPPGNHFEYWPGLGTIVVANAPEPGSNKPGAGGGVGAGSDVDSDGTENANQRFHPATVFVDGVARVACTYNEMPSSVQVEKYQWEPGDWSHRVRLADYLKSLGINLAKVQAVHFYGGRDHVVMVSGEELRKHHKDLYFAFTRDMFGKPTLLVRGGAYRLPDILDIVTDIAVYVDKEPPHFDKQLDAYVLGKDEVVDGVPYVQEKMPRRAVRVNVDSRLIAHIKRNLLEGNVTPVNDPKTGDARYRLNDVLAFNKVAGKVRAIDLVTKDERVVRLTADEVKRGVEFVAPHHAGGEIDVFYGNHQVRVSVVNVYVNEDAPAREMRTLTLGPQARTSEHALPVHGRKSGMISRKVAP
jgi:hypothetical protein